MLARRPDEHGCQCDGAQHYPHRITARVAGIQMPQTVAGLAQIVRHAIDGPVDDALIDAMP